MCEHCYHPTLCCVAFMVASFPLFILCNTSRVHCWIVGENLLPRGPELRWLHPGCMWSDQERRAQPPHESQVTTLGWISLKTTEKTEFVAFNAKFIRRRFRVCCRCFKKIKFLLTLQLNGVWGCCSYEFNQFKQTALMSVSFLPQQVREP